jgi:hypothetical protein
MIDFRKVPYIELSTADAKINARILGFELRQELKYPRALGYIDLWDPAGEIAARLEAGTDIKVRGGRRGGSAHPLLTGIVSRSPERDPSPARKLHVPIADGWAKADRAEPFQIGSGSNLLTPQDLLTQVLQKAGFTATRLSARSFPGFLTPFAPGWELGQAVKELDNMLGLTESTDSFIKQFDKATPGSKPGTQDWVTGFDAEGTFFWEDWREGPLAKLPPVAFTADDLITFDREEPEPVEGVAASEREQRKLARGPKCSFEVFFDPTLVPGRRVRLIGEEFRIVWRRHYHDGERFRTEASCGAVPA